ncbi:FAD-binding oxidoreductase [Zavarzinia aquatilis]|uniref:FAD-binding oxidoreductase n=1 Tax=Zavarzinia aquatilis TaxID=2211142 RepID=A0A317E023_9PROT|nr:FAD-linked oxidase C-terminal domain-containing protein [Zavarzinia aquatilis]PWR20418.1 FAD-binding oxidoreductase [Zavarzinia aquatilis]
MALIMPAADKAVMGERAALVAELGRLLPADAVISAASALGPYECDALTAYVQRPLAVVLPRTTAEVSAVLALCHRRKVKVVPRGAGTSLSGGALPLEDGIVLSLARFNRILDIDLANRCLTAQPGVTNLALTKAVEADGFFYAPDPSSQIACTIGGNVAENSGGVHCLKYGLTTHNLLGLEMVLIDGTVIRLGGGKALDGPGYDLLGVITGSEGLLGVVTEVTVRLTPKPQGIGALLAGFDTVEAAGAAVGAIIGAGIVPGGIEMMDSLAINAAEDFCHPGYPREAAALLIVELDGPAGEVEAQMDEVAALLNAAGARSLRRTRDDAERLGFWAGRKSAFPAVGRISPDYLCMDGTIPRARLSEILTKIAELSAHYGLRCANVFHAGDGNLHPLILYDANIPGELDKAEAFGADILRACVAVGGVLTGEHGVGIEKRDLMGEMFDETDLAVQQRLKCAFDPAGLLNPGKVFPVLHRCAELGRLHVSGGKLRFPELPRF